MDMFLLGAAIFQPSVTNWLRPMLAIIMALVGIGLVVVITMQKGTANNISAINGQEADTYAGKNKSKSKGSILRTLTITCGVVFVVVSIFYFVTVF